MKKINFKIIKEKIINHKITIFIILGVIILSLIKQFLLYNFPINAYVKYKSDDQLMVKFAYSILERKIFG